MTAEQCASAATAAARAALPGGGEDVALGRLAGRTIAVVGSRSQLSGTVLVADAIDAQGRYSWRLPAAHEAAILSAAGLAELAAR